MYVASIDFKFAQLLLLLDWGKCALVKQNNTEHMEYIFPVIYCPHHTHCVQLITTWRQSDVRRGFVNKTGDKPETELLKNMPQKVEYTVVLQLIVKLLSLKQVAEIDIREGRKGKEAGA